MKMIIDARDCVLGRLGSITAKYLLKGNSVSIINSEEVLVSGNKADILDKIITWRKKGGSSQKGPKVSKMPHRLLKRMIRGMLPWNRTGGKEAYKRLLCYVGQGDFKEEEIKNAIKPDFKKPVKYMKMGEITKLL
jgi:large subunit ribosomal protein L13